MPASESIASLIFRARRWRNIHARCFAILGLLAVSLLGAGPLRAADWALNFSGDSIIGAQTVINASARDAAGNRYLAGYIGGNSAQLGGVTLTRMGGTDAFVAKLDAAGNVVWAKNFGGAGSTNAMLYGIGVDGGGNIHVVGHFNVGDMTSPAMTRIGSRDLFVLKLNASGDVVWARNFGGSGASAGAIGLGLDGSGNVYLGGSLQGGDLTTPALAMVGGTAMDITNGVALKLDAAGNVLWSRAVGGTGAAVTLAAMAVDSTGHVHLSGSFDQADLTSPALTAIGNQNGASYFRDGFIVKLDTAGNTAWARNFGGDGASVSLGGLAVDASGTVFAAGGFGTASLTTPALAKSGNSDGLMLKLDTAGNLIAASNIGNPGLAIGFTKLALDGNGNLIAGGQLSSGSLASPALTRIGNKDAVAVKFDATGSVVWARNFGGAGATVQVLAAGADSAGNVYLNGTFNGGSLTTPPLTKTGQLDAYDLRLDAAGNLLGARAYSSGQKNSVTQVSASTRDAAGNLYIAGDFKYGNLVIGGFSLPVHSASGTDAYVAKISPAGTVLWARNYGGSGSTATSFGGIAVDGGGNVYLTGKYSSGALVAPALALSGTTDALVMKLDAVGNTVWARNYGGSGASLALVGIGLGTDGSLYLAGTLSVGNSTSPPLTLRGTSDAVAMKLDAAGNTVWARNYGGASATAAFSRIAVDGNDNAHVAGYFAGGALAAPVLGLTGLSDGAVFKINATGDLVWARHYGSMDSNIRSTGLALDGSGNVLIGGTFDFTGHAYKLDGAGNLLWSSRFSSSGGGSAAIGGVAVSGGSYYAIGTISGGDLLMPALTRIGSQDGFLIRMDGNGNPVWAKNYGGVGSSVNLQPVVADGDYGAYVGGLFITTGLSTPALPLLGAQDGMVQRVTTAYTVTTQADAHSGVSPASGLAVTGLAATFTVTPAAGYTASVSGCGVNLSGIATATPVDTGAISGDCTLSVSSTLVAACGTAAGSASSYAPTANLCALGAAGAVQSGSPWAWSCAGSGASAACSAPNATLPTNGGASTSGRIEISGGGWAVNGANSGGFIPLTGHAKSPPSLPVGYQFPNGLIDLELTGGAGPVTVTLTYSNPLPANSVYWKYGPEPAPGNTAPHWYIYPNAVISGNTVTLTLRDGQQGDDDLTVNGVIRDPGGPGAPIVATEIPTLSEWAMVLLGCLLAAFAAAALSRPHASDHDRNSRVGRTSIA